jgi:hypothetical protein
MKQAFKTIYLPGHPAAQSSQRHIKLAFGPKEQELLDAVRHMTSEEIRQLLGIEHYTGLVQFAQTNALSINRACLSLLYHALKDERPAGVAESRVPYSIFADPLIATYRGGNGELFHHWYPLLEGFSNRFVNAVIETYSPRATKVLDPFAGTGAAPMTVAQRGGVGFYCELNPVLQFVTQAKVHALQLNERRRRQLVEQLRELASSTSFRLTNCNPERALGHAYNAVFQNSQFFDEETFQDVLRLRTLADDLEATSLILGELFTVAVLASLVPCSLMKRAGDLRYKTEQELMRDRMPVRQAVAQGLHGIAEDIDGAQPLHGTMVFLAENARSLRRLPCLDLECVVTSPPYLNGTNYFRNTKLELWFLRRLRSNSDLAYWRARSITAGINDVTQAKCKKPYPPPVEATVKMVADKAYDGRLPLMVGAYFGELQEVFDALALHLRQGAIVAIDIGDSRYAGVHVETDVLLSEIMAELGYQQLTQHTLRQRKSHDGGLLRESLLVLEYRGASEPRTSRTARLEAKAQEKWQRFKSELPHRSDPYRKRNWGHPLHSLCSYQGKMKPSLAHFLVDIFTPEGGKILDPFAGVGTIPFEGALQGRVAFAFEISPAGFAITQAKLGRPDSTLVGHLLNQLETYLTSETVTEQEYENARAIDFNRRLDEFYHPQTLGEILLARRFFIENPVDSLERSFVVGCLLHVLHGNRPYALSRRSHPITPFAPSGPFEYRSLIKHLRDKLVRSLNVEYPGQFRPGVAFKEDSTLWWPKEVDDLDAVITSPPFFDSTRFYLANWIRLWFCGWEKMHFASQPLRFLELKQKESMKVYESLFRQARERLKPDGILVLHLGKSTKCDMAKELTLVARPWFQVVDLFEEDVTDTESHGITDKGKVTGHQFLLLR